MPGTIRTALHVTCDNEPCDYGSGGGSFESEFDNLDVAGKRVTVNGLVGAAVRAGWKKDATRGWICPHCLIAENEKSCGVGGGRGG